MTIRDVAKKAGVSITTVSRVINNKPGGIGKEKRLYIQKIIEEMGYTPNGIARGLATKKTSTIALIVPDITNPFFAHLAKGVEDAALKKDYSVFLCNTSGSSEREKHYLSIIKEKAVDGVILSISQGANREYVKDIVDFNIPTILVDEPVELIDIYGVYFNNINGGYIATKYLIELGHQKIACITGSKNSISSVERAEGYRKALREAGLPIDESIIRFGEYDEMTGFKHMHELLQLGYVTAVFCTCDMMAFGAYRAAALLNKKIPNDISVVGLDDAYNSYLFHPAITDVKQPIYEMGKKAASILIKLLDGVNVRKKIHIFEPELILRNSAAELKEE